VTEADGWNDAINLKGGVPGGHTLQVRRRVGSDDTPLREIGIEN